MKFYKDIGYEYKYYYIIYNKLTCIHIDKAYNAVVFYKNGKLHNSKNSACINCFKHKSFYLNNKRYENDNNFTKQSWRKFVKLQAFL